MWRCWNGERSSPCAATPPQEWCEDTSDYRLAVEPGDRLSIVEETSRGRLVKKDGVTGWYFGRLKGPEREEKSGKMIDF